MPGAATQIFSREFDLILGRLPSAVARQILGKIFQVGLRLESFPHYRMTARDEFRLRVGDYRIIYTFDAGRNEIYLVTLGHRKEIYR